jgi:shikimate kinase
MKNNLIFIGMPAVGKSTVGVVVAKQLGMQFIDTDLLIQEQEKRLLREIIAEEGKERFLQIENQVNRDLYVENSVISPGGSVVYCEEAMHHFKEIGTIIYLKASFHTIKKRIRSPKKRGVVLRAGQTFRDLYNERIRLFEKYADITVCEDGCEIEQTIGNVLSAVKDREIVVNSQNSRDTGKNDFTNTSFMV